MSRDIKGDQWLEGYVPYLLYRVTNKLNARLLARLRVTKTNPARWRVLSVLRAYGTLSVGEIVDSTLMGQPTVSRVVVQLEREGRVTRSPGQEDSRVRRVALTAKGVATFKAIVPTALRHRDLALRGLSRRDIQAIKRVLEKIERNIDQQTRHQPSGAQDEIGPRTVRRPARLLTRVRGTHWDRHHRSYGRRSLD